MINHAALWPGRRATRSELAIREGEALLYEGSRLYHGRPVELSGGEAYLGLFTGFVPEGYPRDAPLPTRLTVGAVRSGRALAFWTLRQTASGASMGVAVVAAWLVLGACGFACRRRRSGARMLPSPGKLA